MWELELPELDAHLRQGDLLDMQNLPARGTWTFDASGFKAAVKVGKAIVLDQCCTVEQKHTVLLARVGRVGRPPDEAHIFLRSLRAVESRPGELYATYEHLLGDLGEILPYHPRKLWIVKLIERVSLAADSDAEFAELRARRVARMTIPSRAQLRHKLAFHFGRVEASDAAWLEENGFDPLGRPVQ